MKQRTTGIRRVRTSNALTLLTCVTLLACAAHKPPVTVPIVRTDLPVLKATVLTLYDRLTAEPVPDNEIMRIETDFRRLHDLEISAGGGNENIAKQIFIVLSSFHDHIQIRRTEGPFNEATRDLFKRDFARLMDQVIVTEQRAK